MELQFKDFVSKCEQSNSHFLKEYCKETLTNFIALQQQYFLVFRTEAMGFFEFTKRVGAMLAPWVLKWLRKFHWRIPFTVMGALAVIASLLLEWLPETKHKNTKEIIELPTARNKPEQQVKLIKSPTRVRRDNTPKLVTIKSKPSRIIIG